MGHGPDAATAWESEYERGRYLTEGPVDLVADILEVAAAAGLGDARGLYIGCGNGRNLVPMVQAGLDLLGLDVSATAIAQLRDRLPLRADRLVVGDLGALPDDLTFPIVIGIQVFQHGTRAEAHAHVRAALARTDPGGLFCVRVNAVGTDVWPAHELVEGDDERGFTVRYTAGAKAGLHVHFFGRDELEQLVPADFASALPLRIHRTRRRSPAPGQWSQWEGIWRRGT